MFAGRSKRSSRDRDCGLVFQWRLPVGNHWRFIAALCTVAVLGAGLAAAVRVRAGAVVRQPERRGSLVLIPRGEEWRALEMLALEAGPMPLRPSPSGDPAVEPLIEASMAAGMSPGYRYRPSFQPVEVTRDRTTGRRGEAAAVLPPLPEPEPPSAAPPLPERLQPVALASGPLRIVPPAGPVPPGLAHGSRYLLAYGRDGRVTRAAVLFSAKEAGNAGVEAWLRQLRVEGGEKEGGWTAVEISSDGS